MALRVLILGVNGFIGNALAQKILEQTDWFISGLDILSDNLEACLGHERFDFHKGDINKESSWIDEKIKTSDVCLPLVAIANPAIYVQDPLRVFELDFETNLDIIKRCVAHKTRVVFPSTSEVYGMCTDNAFNEETSSLVLGPIQKERWIYSCSKQLLDRVIYAYGKHHNLPFTLFRPFNWMGPKLDRINPNAKTSRVITQFISNVIYTRDIQLVDGGQQKRCFTYLDDGIEALIKIIANDNNRANGQIFNIGNPDNNLSIREVAELLLKMVMEEFPSFSDQAKKIKILDTKATQYYGEGYQDINSRVPDIKNACNHLNWQPKTDFQTALRKTLQFYLQ